MLHYQNLTIIGTSHISKDSVKLVEKRILEIKPEVVAIELDSGRFHGLLSKEKRKLGFREIREIGFKGWLFAKFGEYVEKKLGSKVGVSPGDEMLKAHEIAVLVGAKTALIDQPIEITLKRFSKRITWRERFRFVWDLMTGWFRKEFKIEIDLNKVPDEKVIVQMLEIVRRRYPNVYDVLITERNKVMAKHLNKLMQQYGSIIAVIGAGHEKEVLQEIRALRAE